MSCKILAMEFAGSVSPMEWARTPGSSPPEPPSTLYHKEERPERTSHSELKIREVEAAAEKRIQEAYSQGRKEGESAAVRQFQVLAEQMASVVQNSAGLRARLRRESEEDLVQLSIAIARRILRRELSVDPAALSGIVKACLGKLEARQVQRVRLHASLAETVRAHLDPSVTLVSDPQLAPGDVRIETDQGEIDAGMETQLAEIERGFADLLPQRRNSS